MDHSHCCHKEHDQSLSADPAILYSLFQRIDTEKVQCLNESVDGSGKTVFKPWEDRLDVSQFVESEVDHELLFYVPFTVPVKLKGVVIIGGEDSQHPKDLKIFKNRPLLGFDAVMGEADQTVELSKDYNGSIEYPLKVARFNSVTSILLFFPTNYGAENTRIYYIGLRGEALEPQPQGIVVTTYEAAPNPTDHEITSFVPAGTGYIA